MAEEQTTIDAPGQMGAAETPRHLYLDKSLFWIVLVVLLFTISLLSISLVVQYQNYARGISSVLSRSECLDNAAILTYSRAWDFAVVKISTLFLGFCLILIGALYVLRIAAVSYSLTIAGLSTKGSLQTGSPGLVMLTLGVTLVVVVVLSSSKIEYYGPSALPLNGTEPIPYGAFPPIQEESPANRQNPGGKKQ